MPTQPLLKILSSLIPNKQNRRKHERVQLNSNPSRLDLQRGDKVISAGLVDFSAGGMSFVVKEEAFDMGDQIHITFVSGDGITVQLDAEVVAQTIYYPQGTQDLQRALYRFSVKFAQETHLQLLQKMVEENPPFLKAA